MKLEILICTLPERWELFERLFNKLTMQIDDLANPFDVEILSNGNPKGVSIGTKRNRLLDMSTAEYVAFIDDDDDVSNNYIATLLAGAKMGFDCIGLRGEITINGGKPEIFEHSLKYDEWKTNEGAIYPNVKYERFPNHLNCIKSSIAKQFKYPETNHGEDFDWSTQLHKSGLLKTEYEVNHTIYYYNYLTKK